MSITNKDGVVLVCDYCDPAVELVAECPKCGPHRYAELERRALAALKSWDQWQSAVEQVVQRPVNYAGWQELEELRALLPQRGQEGK